MTNRQAWVLHTEAADRQWKDAQRVYWADVADGVRSSVPRLRAARTRYRAAILDGFWRFVAPITPGKCVPNSVAECMAEDWDECTQHSGGPS